MGGTLTRRGALLGAASVVAGCSPADLVNSMVPREGFALAEGLVYGDDARRRLDVYTPAGATAAPVVVFFYGGAWRTGERGDYLFVGQAFAERGFVAVIPDYRLYPQTSFPGFLEDCAAAVGWVRRSIGGHGGDPAGLHLAGHSAGAYNAVMLALAPRFLAAEGLEPRRDLASVTGLAGPYDFLPLGGWLRPVFGSGPPEATQPIRYAHGNAPPMLLASGADDTTVYPRNSERLAERLRALGGEVEERYYSGVGHIPLVGALGHPFRGIAPVLDDVTDFVRRHPRPTAARP